MKLRECLDSDGGRVSYNEGSALTPQTVRLLGSRSSPKRQMNNASVALHSHDALILTFYLFWNHTYVYLENTFASLHSSLPIWYMWNCFSFWQNLVFTKLYSLHEKTKIFHQLLLTCESIFYDWPTSFLRKTKFILKERKHNREAYVRPSACQSSSVVFGQLFEWLELLSPILKIQSSKPGPKAGCIDWDISMISIVASNRWQLNIM
jgi:hypothetical protein